MLQERQCRTLLINSLFACHKAFKAEVLINEISAYADSLSHCEGCGNSADAKSLDVTKTEECKRSRYSKTAYVKAYLYFRIADFGDVGKLSRKQVGRNYWKSAAV